jgi:hypothetical protein
VLLSLDFGELQAEFFNFARGTRPSGGGMWSTHQPAQRGIHSGGREKEKEGASANAKNWQRRVASCSLMAIDGPCFVVVCQLCLPRQVQPAAAARRRGGIKPVVFVDAEAILGSCLFSAS